MIRREMSIFLIVGTLTVLVDFLSYRSVIWSGLLTIDIAKAIGFLTGTVFAYFANRVWTFGHKKSASGSAFRFVLLYALTLFVNVMVNSAVLHLLQNTKAALQIAFLIATAISAMLNFMGMKWFVFKKQLSKEAL